MLAHQPDRYPLGAIRAGSGIMIQAAKLRDFGPRPSQFREGPGSGPGSLTACCSMGTINR